MFAVPGWSVPASSLKKQTVESSSPNPAANGEANAAGAFKPNKKRKRSSGKSGAYKINAANVADMYEKVIEGRGKINGKSTEHDEKRQKIFTTGEQARDTEDPTPKAKGVKVGKKGKGKTPMEKGWEKKADIQQSNEPSTASTAPNKLEIQAPPTLTPLQAKMRNKLISARFRHLNQTLYTTPSSHSLELFKEAPETFAEYHEGFRRQVEVWPENPVESYIADIKSRAQARGGPGPEGIVSLPRTEKVCRIADLGCGDAALSTTLQKDAKKANLKIHSFDLHSPNSLVTRADIASLPLDDGSVDVAIFCLALMGTNWVDFIEEAFRILRWKGELWVAEIKSRFGRVGSTKGGRVQHSVGNRQKRESKKDKRNAEEEDAVNDNAALMVEVDGNEDMNQETDVSAFVEVLKKRGFVLKGEDAVDLRNRMFVKMHFVKGVTPIKGKCVPVPDGMEKLGLETWKKKVKAKFTDKEDEMPISTEAGVLKPCVYKLR